MNIQKKASASWGGGKDGAGSLSTESGALNQKAYSFKQRFEGEKGTNPEELIGAALAGCFTMALAKALGEAGFKADQLDTEATVTLENVEGGFAITAVALNLEAKVSEIEEKAFQDLATKAKEGCPVSKLLKAEINLSAKLL